MRTRMLAVGVVSATAALLAVAGASLADPPDTLISPPNHRHFLVLPTGEMQPIGPSICDGATQQAFNAFHYNVHHSEVPGIGDIPTLGPQDGAPGLHNGRGAEIIGVRGCS